MDATRISDSKQVYVKTVRTCSDQLKLLTLLSSPPLCDDPRNPCPPVLDSFVHPEETFITFVVMPLLRMINRPPFASIRDVLDFVDQMLNVRGRSLLWRSIPDTSS